MQPDAEAQDSGASSNVAAVDACVATQPLPATASSVLDRLAASEQQRKADRERRREADQQQANPQENVNALLSRFASAQTAAAAQLDALWSAHGTPGTAAPTPHEAIPQTLDTLAQAMLAQERSLAEAAYFLPSFDLRACSTQIQEFKTKLDAARAALLPRRKFVFSAKKVSRVKGQELAPTHAPAPATQGVVVQAAEPPAGVPGGTTTHDPTASPPAIAATITPHDQALIAAGAGLSGLRDQVVVWGSDRLAGRDCVVAHCERCRVYLLGHMGALRVLGLRGCTLVTGPVTGATFIDDVHGCTLVLASYQVRVHRAVSTDLYLRTRSRPIIEHSVGIRVAPYSLQGRAQRVQELLARHQLHEENGMHRCMDDFGWIKAMQSPNWREMDEAERVAVEVPDYDEEAVVKVA